MSAMYGSYERRSTNENVFASGFQALVRRAIGTRLTADEVWRREMATSLVKARLGARTIEEARRKSDDRLGHLGAATTATALLEVEDPQRGVVPPEVADEVSRIAERVLPPDLGSNPYVSDETAQRVATLLGHVSVSPHSQ